MHIPAKVQSKWDEASWLHREMRGQPDLAFRLVRVCNEILSELSIDEAPSFQALVLGTIGDGYRRMPTGDPADRLETAIKYYERAEKLISPKLNALSCAVIQGQLGTAYLALPTGDPYRNMKKGIEKLEIALTMFPPDTPPQLLGTTHGNLAKGYMELPTLEDRPRRLEQAIEHLHRAANIFSPDSFPLEYATAQTSLCRAYLEVDTPESLELALACCKEALRFQTVNNSPVGYGTIMSYLGSIYSSRSNGNREENLVLAEAAYLESLRVFTPEEHPEMCVQAHSLLGHFYAEQQKWHSAYKRFLGAIYAGEQIHALARSASADTNSTSRKIASIARLTGLYRFASYAAARCGNTIEALLTLEFGKARLLSEALDTAAISSDRAENRLWLRLEQAIADVLYRNYNEIQAQRDRTYIQALNLRTLLAFGSNQGLRVPTTANMASGTSSLYEQTTLETATAVFRSLVPDASTVLISFCLTKYGSSVFIVGRDPRESVQCLDIEGFRRKDLSDLMLTPEIDGGLLIDYRIFHEKRYSLEAARAAEDYESTLTAVLDELGRRLLTPIVATLHENITKLILLPCDALVLLPLHATRITGTNSGYLCDRYVVSYAPSARVLSDSYDKSSRAIEQSMYMLCNPTEDRGLTVSEPAGIIISELFLDPILHQGVEGTRAAVLNEAGKHAYLHFFCHGSFAWDDPDQDYLVLSDGSRLTLADLQSGRLSLRNARAVVLAVCEAGLPDLTNFMYDECISISSGFLWAGAPCVISPLWSVEVVSTVLLMDRFYHYHIQDKLSFAEALRDAQCWLRNLTTADICKQIDRYIMKDDYVNNGALLTLRDRWRERSSNNPNRRPFAHPYYWAGFTVNGR